MNAVFTPAVGPVNAVALMLGGPSRRTVLVREIVARLRDTGHEVWLFTPRPEHFEGATEHAHTVYPYINIGRDDARALKRESRRRAIAVVADGLLQVNDAVSRMMDFPNVTVAVVTSVARVLRGRRWAWRFTEQTGWAVAGAPKTYVEVTANTAEGADATRADTATAASTAITSNVSNTAADVAAAGGLLARAYSFLFGTTL